MFQRIFVVPRYIKFLIQRELLLLNPDYWKIGPSVNGLGQYYMDKRFYGSIYYGQVVCVIEWIMEPICLKNRSGYILKTET